MNQVQNGGTPKADDRDPKLRCTYDGDGEKPRCGNYSTVGSDTQRCRFHGGLTTGAIVTRRQAEINKALAPIDPNRHVTPADFPEVVAEYVERFNRMFGRLEAEMDDLRATTSEIELARDYADILNRQAMTAGLVSRLMDSAAKLGISAAAIAQTKIEITEAQARTVYMALRMGLEALGLSESEQEIAKRAVVAYLAAENATGRINVAPGALAPDLSLADLV